MTVNIPLKKKRYRPVVMGRVRKIAKPLTTQTDLPSLAKVLVIGLSECQLIIAW